MYSGLVTIMMPVYNAEKYLKDAIESILQQTYSNFEFIITNDGSTDNSLEIIKDYAERDKRIIVISRENKGLVYTLNEQLNIANGKYIVRMDADDISDKERIKKQVRYMEKNKDIYLAGTYYDLIIEQGTDKKLIKEAEKGQKRLNSFTDDLPQHIFMGYILLHGTWIFRKKLIDILGGYRDYKHSEDGEFLFRVLAAGYRIGVIPEKLFKCRVSNSSKSNNDRLCNTGIKEDIIKYHMEYLSKCIQGGFNSEYIVWGSDITGNLTVEWIKKEFPDAQFRGYIDSFAEPDKEKQIFRPNFINEHNGYYIFIATSSGLNYAVNYLDKIGKKKIKDYFSVV